MNNLVYVILILIFFLVLIILFINLINKKRIKEEKKKNIKLLEEIKEKYNDIEIELDRCKKISKNEQTKELIENWNKEYVVLEEGLNEILILELELEEYEKHNKKSKYLKNSKILVSTINYFMDFTNEFFLKLKNFTDFEIDNTQMAIDLKERLKELNNIFDQQAKIYGFLSDDFIVKTANINLQINEFEKEQKNGNYPKARVYLKSGNDLLAELELSTNIIIDYYKNLATIDELFSKINTERILLQKYGYNNYEHKLERDYIQYQSKKEYFIDKLDKMELDQKELITNNLEEIEIFIAELNEYSSSLILTSNKINQIENIKLENQEKRILVEELIEGCQDEKQTIKKLYNINNIVQFDKINDQRESFDKFKKDYEKLLNIVLDEDEDFFQYEENVVQTSKYLERVLVNLRTLIKSLEAIRSDEIEIRNKITSYQQELVNLTLYLKEYEHFEKMSKLLIANYNEIVTKIEELNQELEKEPLDIGLVRVLNDVIEKLLVQFALEAQKDIKQRQGVERLMMFYNRFVTTDEYAKYYNHFLGLYNEKEYWPILKEIHTLLVEASEQGDELYKNVVSTIKIEKYNSLI